MTENVSVPKKITDDKKLLTSLGLIMKAGKLICGTELVRDAIRDGKAKIVVFCSHSSENSKKRILSCAGFYGVDTVQADVTPEALGNALGKSGISAVCVTSASFRDLILKYTI